MAGHRCQAVLLSLAMLALGLGAGGELLAQDPGLVWVNPRSMVYHCPGSQHHGVTARGEYLAESEALRRGYRPNGGRSCQTALAGGGPVECRLLRVVDADTLECRDQGIVRLLGIDAPETGQEPYSLIAMAALSARLLGVSTLHLELERAHRDRYGRLLAHAWIEGEHLNLWLVEGGWAVELSYAPNTRYEVALKAAEERAKNNRAGLWWVDGFACRPIEYRRGQCGNRSGHRAPLPAVTPPPHH